MLISKILIRTGLPHTQEIQANSENFQVKENLRETQGNLGNFELFFKLRETLGSFDFFLNSRKYNIQKSQNFFC